MHVSCTSSSAIFCLDWMNAGSMGKTLSNAILFYKVMIWFFLISKTMQKNNSILYLSLDATKPVFLVNNKGADQTARMRKLICAFVVRNTEDRFFRFEAHI